MKIERTGMRAWIISGADSLGTIPPLVCFTRKVGVRRQRLWRSLSIASGCLFHDGWSGLFVSIDGSLSDSSFSSFRFSREKHMAPAKATAGKKRKYFTVQEANNALPLVRMIVGDIVRQDRVVEDLQQRLSMLTRERRRPSNDVYAEELAQSQAELEAEEGKLRSYLDELKKLGVEFKGPDGLCDFYSIMDGREVFLCWRLGEPQVMFWHDLDAGFAGRQPLGASYKLQVVE
jgi:hypothetical protein